MFNIDNYVVEENNVEGLITRSISAGGLATWLDDENFTVGIFSEAWADQEEKQAEEESLDEAVQYLPSTVRRLVEEVGETGAELPTSVGGRILLEFDFTGVENLQALENHTDFEDRVVDEAYWVMGRDLGINRGDVIKVSDRVYQVILFEREIDVSLWANDWEQAGGVDTFGEQVEMYIDDKLESSGLRGVEEEGYEDGE